MTKWLRQLTYCPSTIERTPSCIFALFSIDTHCGLNCSGPPLLLFCVYLTVNRGLFGGLLVETPAELHRVKSLMLFYVSFDNRGWHVATLVFICLFLPYGVGLGYRFQPFVESQRRYYLDKCQNVKSHLEVISQLGINSLQLHGDCNTRQMCLYDQLSV